MTATRAHRGCAPVLAVLLGIGCLPTAVVALFLWMH